MCGIFVMLGIFVLLSSFLRVKLTVTIVTLEHRMLRLLVRVAGLHCGEFMVAVATLELGLVFGLLMGQAVLVRGKFAITVFALEEATHYPCMLLKGNLGVLHLATLSTSIRGVLARLLVLVEWVVKWALRVISEREYSPSGGRCHP